MSFPLSCHQALLAVTGAHWLDDVPDLTCKDGTCQHAVDDPRLSRKTSGWGFEFPISSQKQQVNGLQR
jgi:hypothetical protein